MHIVVAVNPNASFGRNRGIETKVSSALAAAGHHVNVLIRNSFDELLTATRAAASNADALVVVGGDGMVSLGVNALVGTSTPMAIVPAGTGNDFARALGFDHTNLDHAIEQMVASLNTTPVAVDTVSMTSDSGKSLGRYVGVLSAGFDAIVNERANTMRRPRGASRYILALLIELVRMKPRHYRITITNNNGAATEFEVHAVLVAAANNVSLGGGMYLVPHANLRDGKIDLLVAHAMSKFELLRVFPKVFSGKHTSHPKCDFHQGTSIRIETEHVVAYADGERVAPLPLQLQVEPNSLQVFFVPPTS